MNFLPGWSQNVQFNNFNIEEQPGVTHILNFYQDRHGFMWMSSYSGVYRFNGEDFVNYGYLLDSTGLSLPTISIIIEDAKGNFWFGANGLNRYNPITGELKRFVSNPDNPNSLSENNIRTLYFDSDGMLWIGTYGGGLNKFDPKTESFFRFPFGDNTENSLRGSRINCFYALNDSVFWIGTERGGIGIFDKKQNRFNHLVYNEKQPETIVDIKAGINGIIWVGSWEHGLLKYSQNDRIYSKIAINLPGEWVAKSIAASRDSMLWIASYKSGLLHFDQRTGEYNVYRHNLLDPNSVISDNLWSVFIDKNNLLWIGSFGVGFGTLDLSRNKFNFITALHSKVKLSNYNVRSVCEDYSGNLWVGTNNGLNKIDNRTNEVSSYLVAESNPRSEIWSLLPLDSNFLLLGTGNGLLRFNLKTAEFVDFLSTMGFENLSTHFVSVLAEDNFGRIWFSIYDEGVFYINRSQFSKNRLQISDIKRLDYTNAQGEKIPIIEVNDILAEEDYSIWITSEQGVFKIDQKRLSIQRLSTHSHRVLCYMNDRSLWITSARAGWGLAKIDDSRESILYMQQKTLSTIPVIGLTKSVDGKLWLSSPNKLFEFNPADSTLIKYDNYDGLKVNLFNNNTLKLLSSGNIFIGDQNGYCLFNPRNIHRTNYNHTVVITDIKIYNKSIFRNQNTNSFSKEYANIDRLRELAIDYSDKVLTINFLSLSFSGLNEIDYQYKLEGFDTEWMTTSKGNSSATYTNLNGGKYLFKVRAANPDGIWSKSYTSLVIRVRPPLWQKKWFLVLCLSLLIGIIFLVINLRLRRIRNYNRQLELEVAERTHELKVKNTVLIETALRLNETNTLLEERQQQIVEQTEELTTQRDELAETNLVKDKLFSVIAHDLKNPFNSLKGLAELLLVKFNKYDNEKKYQMIQHINNASNTVYDLLVNLLNWARAQTGTMKLNPENTDLVWILKNNIELATQMAAEKEISLQLESSNESVMAIIDIYVIDTVVRNLLTNAIKFTHKNGTILLKIVKQPGKVQIVVEDNGVGIAPENRDKLFNKGTYFSTYGTNNEKGTGLGLNMCKDFVELLGGNISVQGEEGKGSIFIVELPHVTDK